MPEVQSWIEPALQTLSSGRPNDYCFSFTYPEIAAKFQESVASMGVKDRKVLYMARHSGPSIEVARHRKPLAEVQKKGRWASFSSVQRYEKAGRLAQANKTYGKELLAWLEAIEAHCGAMILGSPHNVPLPPGAGQ